jgi:hypothetical protein
MEIDMTNTIEYAFDDIEVTVNGYTYTAGGVIPVEYVIDPVDASVGIFWPSAIIDGFGPVEAELVDENGAITTVVLQRESEAHNKIALTLEKSGCLEEACLDDYYGR